MNDPLLTAAPRVAAVVEQTMLYRDRRLAMTRLGYLLTGSPAVGEELFHDAFEQVVRRWDSIEHPNAYLRLAVVNGARTWARKRRPLPLVAIPDHPAIDADAIAVRDALVELRHEEREALVLRYYAGLSDRQIADVLDRPIGTVKSQIHRGLARMREALT